jgi:hypothetical protein
MNLALTVGLWLGVQSADSLSPRPGLSKLPTPPDELRQEVTQRLLKEWKETLTVLESVRKKCEANPEKYPANHIEELKRKEDYCRKQIAELELGNIKPAPFDMARPSQRSPYQKD